MFEMWKMMRRANETLTPSLMGRDGAESPGVLFAFAGLGGAGLGGAGVAAGVGASSAKMISTSACVWLRR